MKESRSKIKIPIYDSEIMLILTDDVFKSIKKAYRQSGDSELLVSLTKEKCGNGYFIYDDDNVGYYHLILARKKDIFIMTHEVFHATGRILHHHEVFYDVNNDDAFTYLNGFLNQTIYDKITSLK